METIIKNMNDHLVVIRDKLIELVLEYQNAGELEQHVINIQIHTLVLQSKDIIDALRVIEIWKNKSK